MTDLSPSAAERYVAAKARNRYPTLNQFRDQQGFDLDPFQVAACEKLESGASVLVAAPTGAGKTVVAEFAIFQAMNTPHEKVFYTTPIKALSNQKYHELVMEYGQDRVGLLTGDSSINATARIVVMTTEVLRNMLYLGSALLENLSCVVMDEVHYLADRFRGAVWEEVILHLPLKVSLVSLSATVSNAEEFGDWLQAVRGDTAVIVSEDRPVPLHQHVLIHGQLVELFEPTRSGTDRQVNPDLLQLAKQSGIYSRRPRGSSQSHRARVGRENTRTTRASVIETLDKRALLPAIVFIFSRAGCEQAVQQVRNSQLRLTNSEERASIRQTVEERIQDLPAEDLGALGYWEWFDGLQRGIAAHHAGMLPAFKETVEELFQRKLLKVVFATETLALGVNMPARSVVLEKLEKFNGEARVPITPGEYTQLTGRAGRRGIDPEGHSVVLWYEGANPQSIAALASKRTYPLNSSFRPSYNMAVNLISQFGREATRGILQSSFAQFQADRAVVSLARKLTSQEQSLKGYAEAMVCHLGDFREYSRIRRELTDMERNRISGSATRSERDKRQQHLDALRRQLTRHPCHPCHDRENHARWAERFWKLERESRQLSKQIQGRTNAVARTFDRITDVLEELGYVSEDNVSADGFRLARIYSERDLLVAECLRLDLWRELDAPELTAMATSLLFEPRREGEGFAEARWNSSRMRNAFEATTLRWAQLDELERQHQLPGSIALQPGLSLAMQRWASGDRLDQVLREADLPVGDFVRWAKQTIDLLDQISKVANPRLSMIAEKAVVGVRRGIVAYASVA